LILGAAGIKSVYTTTFFLLKLMKHVVGKGILHLQDEKPAFLELDDTYNLNSLRLELKINSSPYLKTNAIHFKTESDAGESFFKEIQLMKTDQPVIEINLSKFCDASEIPVKRIIFMCNYDMVIQSKVIHIKVNKGKPDTLKTLL
jgi:hypothetical protein